jgi:hypothetical protein
MQLLKISTQVNIRIGPFVDDSDGVTPETGLTINQSDIRLSKNGGDFAQSANSGGATHDEYGWYYLILASGDVDTVGRLDISISVSGALPVWKEFTVVPAVVYDSLITGTDSLEVDAETIWSYATRTITGTYTPPGSSALEYTVTDSISGQPIEGVLVKVTTDVAGDNQVAVGYTNISGIVTFQLQTGTYYLWLSKSGYSFSNPDTEVVS